MNREKIGQTNRNHEESAVSEGRIPTRDVVSALRAGLWNRLLLVIAVVGVLYSGAAQADPIFTVRAKASGGLLGVDDQLSGAQDTPQSILAGPLEVSSASSVASAFASPGAVGGNFEAVVSQEAGDILGSVGARAFGQFFTVLPRKLTST